jgi:hypothetical protein
MWKLWEHERVVHSPVRGSPSIRQRLLKTGSVDIVKK